VFSIGLQGQYFMKALTEREELTGLQYNRVPSLNRYLYGASLNFGYVPVYGKFSLFNRAIMSWEIYASAGFGWTRSEIIPRSYAAEKFTNELLTPNAAVGARFFLFNWLTVNFEVRDYIMADKFENKNRVKGTSGADAKANAEQALVNNVMLMAGVGIYLPGGFQYKTAR
jgi:outer membrane beta-barrel protein